MAKEYSETEFSSGGVGIVERATDFLGVFNFITLVNVISLMLVTLIGLFGMLPSVWVYILFAVIIATEIIAKVYCDDTHTDIVGETPP